jgi:MFS family permease
MSGNPFRPLRHRTVRLLWGGSVLSDVGTWVQLVVVGSLVARDTGSAFLTGLIALATFMPQGLAAPIGGLLADRFDRRHVFAAALAGQATATAALAVLLALGVLHPIALMGVILVSSMFGSAGGPAFSSMLPELVDEDELLPMVSLTVYSWNAGRIAGPLLGTVLALSVGPAWSVAFNAATFAVMSVAVLSVRRAFQPMAVAEGSIVQRLQRGWQAMRYTPGCRYGVAFTVLLNLCVAPFMGLIPFYATQVFDGGTGLAGAISATQGTGAIMGGVLAAVLVARKSQAPVLFAGVIALTVSYVAYALAPTALLAALGAGLLGAGSAAFFSTSMAVVQRDAPDAERGRVLAIAQGSFGFGYGIGIMWVGLLADLVGARWAFGAAALALATGFALITTIGFVWRAAVDGLLPNPGDGVHSEPARHLEPAVA